MEDNASKLKDDERQTVAEEKEPEVLTEESEAQSSKKSGGGWGGWGFTAFSVLSDLQKVAANAAEEISRNAAEVAKSFQDGEEMSKDSESSEDDKGEPDLKEEEKEKEEDDDELRKAALDKLGNASEDSLLGQGLKILDGSVENFATGAWQALGSVWSGGSNIVQKIEHSAINLADSIQHGGLPAAGSVAPSIIETGKAFTAKGMQVLELVGKETMDLLIAETGIEVEKQKITEQHQDEDQFLEEVTFDRCFYIYGGPEQLEELEALSNHYALLFNRRKAKLTSDQKSFYDGKLKHVQQIFGLNSEIGGNADLLEKGKNVEIIAERGADEVKDLHDSSVARAAEIASGFTNAIAGLAKNDIIPKTTGRLDALHSEGIHRLSEICSYAVSQLLTLGKSIISNSSNIQEEDDGINTLNIEWPEDSAEKAMIVRTRAILATKNVESLCSSFITGITDVAETYLAASKGSEDLPQKLIQDKANTYSENLQSDKTTAIAKIQDGLQYLSYVIVSTAMPAAS
ncbi:uncharacterized protein LOC124935692 [Impatiens glandulifera]|uniref:uncharacterized protein LOC124935692 n=1 Tax=Impatiens glandulifera TaxID=253017 RepID=UPI001FB1440F|nr:uncharacterized protein LOC124935692 [Impatiens glandulifera]